MTDRIHAYLDALRTELVMAETRAAQGVASNVTEIKAEIHRVEVELGIAKPDKRRTPDAKAERAIATPVAERT